MSKPDPHAQAKVNHAAAVADAARIRANEVSRQADGHKPGAACPAPRGRSMSVAVCLGTHQAAVGTSSTAGGPQYIVILSANGNTQITGVEPLLALREVIDYALSVLADEQEGGDA